MAFIRIENNPSRRQLTVFGVIWLVFFGIVGGLVLKNGGSERGAATLWGLAVAVPLVGWIVPRFMRVVYIGLSYATLPIGLLVSYLILAILYYVVLTPIGLLMRLFDYDPMNRRFDAGADTYWYERRQDEDLNRFFRQF